MSGTELSLTDALEAAGYIHASLTDLNGPDCEGKHDIFNAESGECVGRMTADAAWAWLRERGLSND